MDDNQFWSIIESGGPETLKNNDAKLDAIHDTLMGMSPKDIRDFPKVLYQKVVAAYTWDLWGAAYQINGGCSDDGFLYFRGWLISRGRAVYEAAVKNPDTLAEHVDADGTEHEMEDIFDVASKVYEELMGEELRPVDVQWPKKPSGTKWDFDDDAAVAAKLPGLAKIYLH